LSLCHTMHGQRYGTILSVAALKPTPIGRWDPKPWGTRQRWSPPKLGREAQSYRARGSTRAHPGREARFGAARHVAAPKPASVAR
jgi:hypothetical protein